MSKCWIVAFLLAYPLGLLIGWWICSDDKDRPAAKEAGSQEGGAA